MPPPLTRECARYRAALEYIANPLAVLQREAVSGQREFNGLAAQMLAHDANHLRSIAAAALKIRRTRKRGR